MSPPRRRSTSSATAAPLAPAEVLGSTTPRLWTPPLVDLTPDTSYGYDLIDFARDVVGTPFDPWQQWLAVHMGELLPDGRPRFRVALILVARQNGKTLFAKTLILYWLFVERTPLVLGTSTDRSYAKRTWSETTDLARSNRWLARRLGPNAVRLTMGEETFKTLDGAEYTFAANNRRAGRSMTVHRWVADELREHHDRETWDSASNAMAAVPHGQIVAITNQGDDLSIMLDSLREPAVEYIETGVGDPRLGLFEWSSPPGSDPTDLEALAQANPNLGRRTDVDALLGAARRAKRAGGIELAGFRTEAQCMRVALLDSAIDPDLWDAAATEDPIDLGQHKERVALCLDVSLAGDHASLIAAGVVDGKAHVDVVHAWDGAGCTAAVRAELPDLVAKVRPNVFGWFPSGPSAMVAADLTERRKSGWPPRRVKLEEIRADTCSAAMGLAEQVTVGDLVHSDDPMLTAHIRASTKLWRGDQWTFGRRGAGPVDGAYAAAGAVHLARTLRVRAPLSVA